MAKPRGPGDSLFYRERLGPCPQSRRHDINPSERSKHREDDEDESEELQNPAHADTVETVQKCAGASRRNACSRAVI
jgi:hypothetical protein